MRKPDMEHNIQTIPSSGDTVDLNALSIEQLYRLHYEEEKAAAEAIKKMPPFSQERTDYLNAVYPFIRAVQAQRKAKEGTDKGSFGATKTSIALVETIVRQRMKQQANGLVLYEAGVGSGAALSRLKEIHGIEIYGCDVYLTPAVRAIQGAHIHIEQSGIVEHLSAMRDNSIDVFYADQVFEHLLPDETDYIYQTLFQKLKPDGVAVLIIPCAAMGPNDISRHFLPIGSRAEGFHFNERSFREHVESFQKNGLEVRHLIYKIPGKPYRVKSDPKQRWMRFKQKTEFFWRKLPIGNANKRRIYSLLGYQAFLLSKADSTHPHSTHKTSC